MSKYSYKIDKEWANLFRFSMKEGLEYCRRCLTNEDLTFDHIIPRCLNGPNTRSNLTILCSTCNNTKGQNYWSGLTSLEKISPVGWITKPKEEVQLGDETLAGTVIGLRTIIPTRHLLVETSGGPWPSRRGGRGVDCRRSFVWIFVGAEIKELANA